MATLLYDGECSLCRAFVAWVKARDPGGAIELLPFQDPGVAARFPSISPARCLRAAQFVTEAGHVAGGAAAVREVLLRLRSTEWLGRTLRFPPLFWLARAGYWIVARVRPKDRCTISSG